MKLKCEINNEEYDIVNGATFSEEYNETLDSGSIILTGVPRLTDLRPFDDVYIYDSESEFKGYKSRKSDFLEVHTEVVGNTIRINKDTLDYAYSEREFERGSLLLKWYRYNQMHSNFCRLKKENDELYIGLMNEQGVVGTWYLLTIVEDYYWFNFSSFSDIAYFEYFTFKVRAENIETPTFYKHLLIESFTEERLNPVKNIYKYKITLFSEIKKLEKIPLPNISITQPLDITLRKNVADYIKQYVSMYSPNIKVATSDDTFMYVNKYEVDDSVDDIFGNVYCPNFTLNNPSLRDLLNQLFLVKDRIPYVKDDVIYALDITERTGIFNFSKINSITGSRSSENHANGLKRTHNEALSGRNTARKVEYMGFRNSDNALLTLDNMRVETKFPIYKINKIYMCYYKKAQVWSDVGGAHYTGQDKVFLCKQDITKLIKLDNEQAILSKDWNDFENNMPSSIDQMAQYKLCTLSYSIGSNKIEGWGTQYEYPSGWWGTTTITKTYIENIFNCLEDINPYGVYKIGYLTKELGENEFITIDQSVDHKLDNIVSPIPIQDGAKRLKSFFFMVDYEAFYNGTITTSKDDENRDDIISNDNPSSSLTLLEKDGLFQKEKANRFGNMAYTYYATYDDIEELQSLGSVDDTLDEDVIIYHREYSIYENYIRACYYGSKDYVLKNYFTSVYAKHRTFNLLSYNQSIIRAENRKLYLMLSKDTSYYEMVNSDYNLLPPMLFTNFNTMDYISSLISFCNPSPKPTSIDRFSFPEKINYGYLMHNGNKYANDINVFSSGYSLCLNISMWDNISMGNYISDLNPQMEQSSIEDDMTGSVQSFYSMVDSVLTGFTESIGIYFSHTPEESFSDVVLDYEAGIENTLYDKLNALPLIQDTIIETNTIGGEYKVNKDNKEVIDMTFQIEPYTNDKNVLFSEWLFKLCDLYGVYNKFDKNITVKDVGGYLSTADVYCGTTFYVNAETYANYYYPMMCLKINSTTYNNLDVGTPVAFSYAWTYSHYDIATVFPTDWVIVGLDVQLTSIIYKTATEIKFGARCVKTLQRGWWGGTEKQAFETEYILSKVSRIGDIDFSSDTSNYYFTNIATTSDSFILTSLERGQYGDGNTNITLDTTAFNNNNSTIVDLQFGVLSGAQKDYFQNMYIRATSEPLKKTLVYDEYEKGSLDNIIGTPVSEIMTIEQDVSNVAYATNNKTYIKIDLTNISNTKKSLEFWYCEKEDDSVYVGGTLHFVFGVNLTEEDFTNGYVKIYASLLAKKDTRVFGVNNKVVGEIVNYEDNDKSYGEMQYYVLK